MKLSIPPDARERLTTFVSRHAELLGALAVFGVAVALRLPLTRLGLPYAAHPDEAQLLHRGIEMVKTGELNPGYFNYPSFPMYVHAVVAITSFLSLIGDGAIQSLNQVETMLDTGLRWQRVPELFLLRGRQLSVLLGSLGVVGGYLSVARLFGPRIGLVAGLVTALSIAHVNASRFIATDAFATCFTSFAVLAAIEVWRRGRLGDYAFAGALAALSAASKYNAGAVVLVAVFAHFLRDEHENGHLGPLALLAGVTGVGFVVANPYTVLDLPTFVEGIAAEIRHYSQGDSYGPANVAPGLPHLFRLARFLVSTDGVNVWAALALLGPIVGARYGWKRWALLGLYPVVAIALLVGQAVFFPRNLILLVPWVSGAAAVTMMVVLEKVPALAAERAKVATWVVRGLLAAPALVTFAWVAQEATRAESRVEAVDFARTALPPGSKVAVPMEMDLVLGDWAKDPASPSKPVLVRLADMRPATLVAEGVTHAILSDKFAFSGGFGGLTGRKVELINEGVSVLPALLATGGGNYTLGANMFAPKIGVYRLDDAALVAEADAKFAIPAADPTWGYVSNGGFEDEMIGRQAPGFMLIPPTLASGEVVDDARGKVFRIDAKPDANPTMLCMASEVALGGPLVLSGHWKADQLDPGARAQVRFWTGGSLATIREAASINGTADWAPFRSVVDVPEGVKRTKVCIFLQGERGTLWLDDLSLAPAQGSDTVTLGAAPTPAAAGPALPGAWSSVPDSLPVEGRAGPEGDDGFFVVGRPGGESLVCDNTPRPVRGDAVKVRATVTVSGLPPGTPAGQLPRVQVRGMAAPGGAAVRIDETLVFAADRPAGTLTGTAVIPAGVSYWKVCAVVRTAGTKLTLTGFVEE